MLWALVACGGLAGGPGGGKRDCIDETGVHQYGSTFPAGDDCNTCRCEAEGEIVCTRSFCNTCENLPARYAEALRDARSCDPKLRVEQCTVLAGSTLLCGCPTFVSDDSKLRELASWFQAQACAGPVLCGECPEAPVAGECTSEGACADVLGEPLP